ncbi:MAG: DAK2 domain-containing protein [Bacteroidales bacterium]
MIKAQNMDILTGKNLYYIFLAGAHKIIEHQKELNDINVFPVPDADTGSNLASTIRSIIEKIRPDKLYKKMAGSIANAALDGARGNSGVIFAQFLYGTSNETCDCQEMNIDKFAHSVKNASIIFTKRLPNLWKEPC